MLISAATGQVASIPKVHEIFTKSQLTGDPAKDFSGSYAYNPWLFFSDDDRAMIKQMSGASIDPETGRLDQGLSPSMFDFVNDLSDKRIAEYMAKKAPAKLDEGGIRDIFKKAAMGGQNLDPALLQKALDWLSADAAIAASKKVGPANAAAAPPPRIDMYA